MFSKIRRVQWLFYFMEIWKDVLGFEGLYRISNNGRVFSVRTNRFLKCGKNSFGYSLVVLAKNGVNKSCKVHRLVALHFIPNPENKPQVNHINGVKTDNGVENLEWCTAQENIKHSWNNNLSKPQNGEKHGMSKLKHDDVLEIQSMLKNGKHLQKEIASMFGVVQQTISYVKSKM